MKAKPVHQHDCECCTYLGTFLDGDECPENYDLYHCDQMGMPTVIARYGPDGDYMSGMVFAANNPLLGLAKLLAERRGLNCKYEGQC